MAKPKPKKPAPASRADLAALVQAVRSLEEQLREVRVNLLEQIVALHAELAEVRGWNDKLTAPTRAAPTLASGITPGRPEEWYET